MYSVADKDYVPEEKCSDTGYAWNKTGKRITFDERAPSSPEFDDLSIRVIQANIGQTVLLPCTVRNLGDKVVSWIRTMDLHILTTSTLTFSADNRFESVHSAAHNFWGLRIRGVRISDSGRYECQVNTDPKMSLAMNLSVTGTIMQNTGSQGYKWSSFANIKGPPDVNVRKGSSITFTCEISTSSASIKPPASLYPPIYWLHDGKPISFESHKRLMSVETDYRNRNCISRLRIGEVSMQDGGVYTCTQASAKPYSVTLIILETEHTEAMLRDAPHSRSTKRQCSTILFYALNILFITFTYFIQTY